MAGKFGACFAGLSLMPQDHAGNFQLFGNVTSGPRFHVRIVVAGDPDPFDRARQGGQHARCVRFKPGGAFAVMEIVAQSENSPHAGFTDCVSHTLQRLPAVIGGKHLAVLGVKARFFQMEICHQQRGFTRPVERTRFCQREFMMCERKGNHEGHLPQPIDNGKPVRMIDTPTATARAKDWFETLRTQICEEFEAIEREAGSDAAFTFKEWDREEAGNDDPGGGVQGIMKGKVFEKVGVNVSTVRGSFSKEFAGQVNGASAESPGFTATGISLVAHMANPHVPAVHMNTRFLTTGKSWFGGGADLNPPIPSEDDTADFHAAFRAACAGHNPTYYDKFKKWADDYFYIPHRQCHRGVGGIFYDHLECDDDAAFDRNFAFTKDVGQTFLDIYPKLVRRRMQAQFTDVDKQTQLEWRGRYAEFNLVYDRGTLFGLKTGGNIDAILMSLPPEAVWS